MVDSYQSTASCNAIAPNESIESTFPWKIHIALDESERQGFEDIVSWEGKRAFAIHKPKKFEDFLMKEYFNQTNYKSFRKQLHLHGFERLPVSDAIGGSYTHKLLIRGKPDLCRFIVARRIKMEMRRRASSLDVANTLLRSLSMRRSSGGMGGLRRSRGNNFVLPGSLMTGFSFDSFRFPGDGIPNFRWETDDFQHKPSIPLLGAPSGFQNQAVRASPSPCLGGTETLHGREEGDETVKTLASFPFAERDLEMPGRDRAGEDSSAVDSHSHLVRTLDASLSVLRLATRQQSCM